MKRIVLLSVLLLAGCKMEGGGYPMTDNDFREQELNRRLDAIEDRMQDDRMSEAMRDIHFSRFHRY